MAQYIEVTNDTITNIIECDDDALAKAQGWRGPIALDPTIGIGATTTDNGVTWTPPVPPVSETNAATIEANLLTQLRQIEGWIAANPNGATLTAPQTLILARMLAGLTRNQLGLTETVGGS